MKRALLSVMTCLQAALALSALGCTDELPKATKIEQMRILGSQLSVVGDETRATPKPGERVRVSFATVFPDFEASTDDSQLMLLACTAPDRFTGGIPICQEFIDAAESGNFDIGGVLSMPQKVHCSDIPGRRFTSMGVTVACVDGNPSVELPIKAGFTAKSAMFIGVLCEKGRAFIDPNQPGLFGCDDNDGETIALHATFPVQRADDEVNHNPSARELQIKLPIEISIDGEWRALQSSLLSPAVALPSTSDAGTSDEAEDDAGAQDNAPYPIAADTCERINHKTGDRPTVPRGDIGHHTFTLRYPANAREEVDGEAEPLEITVHATSGDMERRFTVFTSESETHGGMLEDTLEWEPSNDAPDHGELVRFYVTLRDQRGGFDMATYVMCSP